jgi:hypothetical protein
MTEPEKSPKPVENGARSWFTSDCDLLEIREEDTKPGRMSASTRKWLEEKYGRKGSPPKETETGDKPTDQ